MALAIVFRSENLLSHQQQGHGPPCMEFRCGEVAFEHGTYLSIPNRLFFAVIAMKCFNLCRKNSGRLREPSMNPILIR